MAFGIDEEILEAVPHRAEFRQLSDIQLLGSIIAPSLFSVKEPKKTAT
jgi:hypothetical protein